MVRWHCWLDGHEFEEAPGVGDGRKSLSCCSPWGHKELNTTEGPNYYELPLVMYNLNVVKPGAWLTRSPPGVQQSQHSSHLTYGAASLALTAGRHSQSGQCPGRWDARSEACSALTLKPEDYLFNFPNKNITELTPRNNNSASYWDWKYVFYQ